MPSSRGVPRRGAPRTGRWLPHALVATAFVVVLPALVVWEFVPRGEPALLALSVPLGMVLSVLAAGVGGAIWKRTPGSLDLVFDDLMLWGWLRRVRTERRLARAETLLGEGAEPLSVEALTKLSALLEARDSYTYGHSQRVTRHAERIARAMGLSSADVAKVRTAAALHDVGKLHTPRAILNKPSALTEDEFKVIRRHPGDGAAMATGLDDPMITAMIRHHHERLDGAGYPAGLAGGAIPLGARIIAVADTFDALSSNRAYRPATSHKRAIDALRREAGTQLDPPAVAAFLSYYRGRRTVVWSAFATAAPQRLFAWLGSVSPGVGAGAAGAAALAIGVAAPQAAVIKPGAAQAREAAKRADAPARRPALSIRLAPVTGGVALEAGRARPSRGELLGSAPRVRARKHAARKRTAQGNRPAIRLHRVRPVRIKPVRVKPPQASRPDVTKPPKARAVTPPEVVAPVLEVPKPVTPELEPPAVAPRTIKTPKEKASKL